MNRYVSELDPCFEASNFLHYPITAIYLNGEKIWDEDSRLTAGEALLANCKTLKGVGYLKSITMKVVDFHHFEMYIKTKKPKRKRKWA